MTLIDIQSIAAGLRADELDGAMNLITASLRELPAAAVVTLCGRFRDQLDAVESHVLAKVVAADGDDRRVRRLATRPGASKRDSARRTQRAKAVSANPALGDQLAAGDLSSEELDLLANAATKSDDDALFDEELISRVSKAGPDQGRRIVRRWLHDRDDARTVQEKHDRQRRLRTARRYDTADGLAAITMEGDDATIDAIWNRVTSAANAMYRADGGRDTPAADHERTHDQRLFDALAEQSSNGGGATSSNRPTVVVTVSLDKLVGNDRVGCANQIGTGPIADTVLTEYLSHGDVVAMLFGSTGEPLWLGRKRRHASTSQFLALMVRDRGCVLCSAAAHLCHAHHRVPWHAPARGQTDIDQLVLLCGGCHRGVHGAKQTLEWDGASRTWTTRPATADELPPDRPQRHRPERHRPQRHQPQRE